MFHNRSPLSAKAAIPVIALASSVSSRDGPYQAVALACGQGERHGVRRRSPALLRLIQADKQPPGLFSAALQGSGKQNLAGIVFEAQQILGHTPGTWGCCSLPCRSCSGDAAPGNIPQSHPCPGLSRWQPRLRFGRANASRKIGILHLQPSDSIPSHAMRGSA